MATVFTPGSAVGGAMNLFGAAANHDGLPDPPSRRELIGPPATTLVATNNKAERIV